MEKKLILKFLVTGSNPPMDWNRQFSGCPCGISRKGGNVWLLRELDRDSRIDGETVELLVEELAWKLLGSSGSWAKELPVLRAALQARACGCHKPREIAVRWGISVPRAEFVASHI